MDLATLPDDPATLKQIVLQLHQQVAQAEQTRQQEIERVKQEQERLNQIIAHLRRRMYGPRSEKINANQLLLFGESILPLTSPQEALHPIPEPATVQVNRPRGHGRRIIPANLPRETVTIPVPAEERRCGTCASEREKIGEEVSEQLEFIPARLFVRRFLREKLACPRGCDQSVVTADKPLEVIEKGLAGPGLIAHVITAKYADHLPLYRLEGIFARHGIELSRSTLCDWMAGAAELARPLVELMRRRILSSKVIGTDDTPVPVQDPGRTKTGRLWVYVGDQANPYHVLEYTPDRRQEHPQAWLKDYAGYVQADAYGGYDKLYASGKVIEVGCWAHARRKFVDAQESSPALCNEALCRIGRLYQIEREAKDLEEEARRRLRQERSRLQLQELERWLQQTRGQVLPRSPVNEAIGYCLNQWAALCRFTDQGYLAIDNNAAERELRHVAIGRKNWLFAGSDSGGKTAATLYSLIRSALRHELNVEYYLRSVLAHLPGTRLSELPHLLPDVWKRELARETAASPDSLRP